MAQTLGRKIGNWIGLGDFINRQPVPTAKPRNSGLSEKTQADASGKNAEISTEATFADDSKINDVLEALRGEREFQEMERGQDRAKRLLAMGIEESKPQLDLTPLMALADRVGGGNLSKTYKAPKNDAYEQARAYNDKVQDNQRGQVNTIISALNALKTGQTTQQTVAQEAYRRILGADDPARGAGRGGKGYDPTADVRRLQKSLEPFAGLKASWDRLDQLVGGVDKWDGKADIPGIGRTSMLPTSALSKEGSNIKQTYSDLRNQLIYAQSGKQINESEFRRLSEALGASTWSGDREFIEGMKRFRNTLKEVMAQREAGFRGVHPEVIDLYRKGRGATSEDIAIPDMAGAAPAPGTKQPAAPKKPARQKALEEMTDAELEAYEKSLKGGK